MYHLRAWCLQKPEETIQSTGTAVTIVSYYVGAGNRTQLQERQVTLTSGSSTHPIPLLFKRASHSSALLLSWRSTYILKIYKITLQ